MNDLTPIAVIRTRAERRRRISLIWAIPLITAMVAVWLAYDTLTKRGPLIEIRFDAAASLQANQSHIRYREVDLGVVQKVALSPDRRHVIVSARMNREALPLLTDKTQFWVVRPRFFAGSVSGLETLVSGAYIQLEPAGDGGTPTTEFKGLEDPPVLRASVPGRTFRLKTARLGSLNPGSPVLFRDLTVGEVLGWDVGAMANEVTVHAFVREPYDKYVHEKSVFWNASGALVQLGGTGIKLELESLRALVLGGIAFDTSEKAGLTPLATQNREFSLYRSRDDADTAAFDRSLRFVSYFKRSVSGLSVGAPVNLHGLRIGAVTEVALKYDKPQDAVLAEVRYEVEPDRIARLDLPVGGDLDRMMEDLVRRGLRIRLESASLVTGSKQIVMDIMADAPAAPYNKQGEFYVLPPLDGDSGDIAGSASALMERLKALPLEQISDNLNKTLAGANSTVNDPNLRQAVTTLIATLNTTKELMASLNKGTDPILRSLPRVAQGLEDAVKHTNQLVTSLDNNYGGGSQLGRDTSRMMAQLSEAARSVRILAELLSRHPEALIRGRAEQEVR